jgi:hypothetical protein
MEDINPMENITTRLSIEAFLNMLNDDGGI